MEFVSHLQDEHDAALLQLKTRCYLSEAAQFPSTHGSLSPVKMAALKRKVGAQRAREPVTNATAVKPKVDNTKL